MGAIRQDAWTEQDDRMLAEVTLRHIREGGTQLSAFAEVGQHIGRTQAACGFRWNSFLRKHYEHDIKQAKVHRQKAQHERRKFTMKRDFQEPLEKSRDQHSLFDLSNQLHGWLNKWRELQNEMMRKNAEIETLRKQNEDYRTLMQMIERARSISSTI
jgi:prespore-specific regulator